MTILVTGGAGFIGSQFLRKWTGMGREPAVNLDKLTYAANLSSLETLPNPELHRFVAGDIGDRSLTARLLVEYRPRAVIHFAAETHVDRSISAPDECIRSNIDGTFALLEEIRQYWAAMPTAAQASFRFLHVSTDEVYGALGPDDPPFTETSPYQPNSPYAASKAASDHLVRAWHATFGLPTIISHSGNNYGPSQHPEKLIPLVIHNALAEKPLPIYGDGRQRREWIYVDDHCDALLRILDLGLPGEVYNIGGSDERSNIELVEAICGLLDQRRPRPRGGSYRELITFVKDRPGHDRRYAIDPRKSSSVLGWRPRETLASGLAKTVDWYLANPAWVERVASGDFARWLQDQYRL